MGLFIYLAVSGLSCIIRDLSMWHTDSSPVHGLQSAWASVVAAFRLSCFAACGILVLRPGIKPASLALQGGFYTTGPPGKSQDWEFHRMRRREGYRAVVMSQVAVFFNC